MGFANPFSIGRRGAASPIDAAYDIVSRVVSGHTAPGATVVVKVNGSIVAAVPANLQGNWTHTLAVDPDGATVTAEVVVAAPEIVTPRALPALPLATGARVAAIGDSQIGYNNTFGGATSTVNVAALSTGYGFIEQASAQDQRFRFDNWYDTSDPRGLNYVGANQGIHGDHLDWQNAFATFGGGILGRLPALLARRPDIVILEGGVNTIATGDDGREGTAAYVVVKLDAMLRLARYAGVWAILTTIYPRGDWVGVLPAKIAIIDQINTWVRAQAGRTGVLGILDAESLLRPNGVFASEMFKSDKVHLSPRGALAVGREKLLPILQSAIVAGSSFSKDRTVNNLLSLDKANLVGTTGTSSGWPHTTATPNQTFAGQIATGMTITKGRNLSIVASKAVIAGAQEQQVLAITPGGGEANNYFEFSIGSFMTVAEAHTPGQWYQAMVEVEASDLSALTFLSLTGGHRTAANAVVSNASALVRESSGDFALGLASGPRTWWITTEPFKLPDGAAVSDKLGFTMQGTGSKSGAPFTLKIRNPIVRRVADPRPVWGYAA